MEDVEGIAGEGKARDAEGRLLKEPSPVFRNTFSHSSGLGAVVDLWCAQRNNCQPTTSVVDTRAFSVGET